MAKKFYTEELFKKHFEISFSYREIAEALNVSLCTAKRYIRLDIESGWIHRTWYYTGHPRKLSLHIGKNHYELTPIGEKRVLMKWSCFFQKQSSG